MAGFVGRAPLGRAPLTRFHHARGLLQRPWLNGSRLPSQGPCATARGPLLEGREARFSDRFPVSYLVLFQ